MKQVVLPFTPQQALALVHDIETLHCFLIRAYEGDFIAMEENNLGASNKSTPLPFDDPLGF